MKDLLAIDKTWSLFLDRDGVLNKEIVGSYVTRWEDFQFEDKALEGLKIVSQYFGPQIIVTNQRGVGKGIMNLEDLRIIHTKMIACIESVGGRIDKVYSATALEDNDHNRKPNSGMAIQANEDFPDIDFTKSVMVGNSMSDMEFGKRLGMHTVFIRSKYKTLSEEAMTWIDEVHDTFFQWAEQYQQVTLTV